MLPNTALMKTEKQETVRKEGILKGQREKTNSEKGKEKTEGRQKRKKGYAEGGRMRMERSKKMEKKESKKLIYYCRISQSSMLRVCNYRQSVRCLLTMPAFTLEVVGMQEAVHVLIITVMPSTNV